MFVKNLNNTYAIIVNHLLKYKNIPTQADLARKFKVSEAYISMLLSGKRSNPALMKRLPKLLTII